jgi:hypothetical protein
MKFQISHYLRFVKLILKNYSLETKTFCKKSSLQRKLVKKAIKIKRKELRKTLKIFIIWIEYLNFLTRLILLPLKLRMPK